jgi:hypothetical protein
LQMDTNIFAALATIVGLDTPGNSEPRSVPELRGSL